MNETETVINLNDSNTIFTSEKGVIGRLTRLGLPIAKQNEYGTWFDVSKAKIVVKVPKIRGTGFKEEVLN